MPASRTSRLGIACNHVVGFDVFFLNQWQRKCARRIADHWKLRLEIFGRVGAMRFILVINSVAECLAGLIQHHSHMRRAISLIQIVRQLPQHRCIAIDGPHRLAMLVGQRRQPVIGAKNISGAVNEVEMLLIRHNTAIAARFDQVFC